MRPLLRVLLVAILVAGACSSDDDVGPPSIATVGPTSSASADGLDVALARSADSALVGHLVIETAEETTPVVEVTGPERSFTIPVGRAATRHELPVAGLRQEQDYTVAVTAGGESVELALRTGSVPDDFPEFDVQISDPARMSDGFTLFNLIDNSDQFAEPDPSDPPRAGYLVAVDDEGEIVWYHRADHPIGDVRQEPGGTIFHEYNDTGARRIDLYGRTLDEWAGQIITGPLKLDAYDRQVAGDDAVDVATDAMHHEVAPLDNGNIVAIGTERRTYEGFPAEGLCDEPDGIDGSYELIVDVIVEFSEDGNIVATHPLADHLDPVGDPRDQNVCGLALEQVFPNWLYWTQGFTDSKDWTHANAVVLDPTGENLTVSIRHLDAVLQIDRASGELVWRFGPGGDFALDDDADFSYHQHAPEWQDDGTLLLYDNGNGRPGTGPPDAGLDPPFSRAVQYRLDEKTGEAEVVWEHIAEVGGRPAFAAFVGDADRVDNGNVLITHGGLGGDRDDGVTAQIVEVVPDPGGVGGDTVFELRIAVPDEHWIIYRAERVSTFYP